MAKERLLITGASSGFVKYLLQKLNRQKYHCIGVSRSLKRLQDVPLDEKIEGDISDKKFVFECVQKADSILHAAAITHALKAQQYYEVNLDSTTYLVDATKEFKLKRFIFISSRTAVPNSGAYGESKLAAEKYIQKHCENWLIFQPSEIFGLTKKEGIEKLIEDTISKGQVLCPAGVTNKMYPIHIDDCMDLTCQAIEDPTQNNQVITLNGSEGFTYEELVQRISRELGKSTRIIPIPKFALQSAAKLIGLLGINAPIVPDQVARLYAEKPIAQQTDYPYKSVIDYAKSLHQNLQ